MLRRFTKKRVAMALAPVAALALAAGAFAYFSSTGTGTGSANVGKSTSFTVGETGSATGAAALYPDASIGTGNIQTHSYKVTNPGAGSQKLNKVVISVANGDGSTWSHGSCTANDFSIGGQAVGQAWTDTTLQGNYKAGDAKTGTVTVQMIDNGQNQDDCQGVTVPLYFSAS